MPAPFGGIPALRLVAAPFVNMPLRHNRYFKQHAGNQDWQIKAEFSTQRDGRDTEGHG